MTSEPLCLDASYLVALFDSRDVWHKEAVRIHATLSEAASTTITPDCVVNEVLTVFARRCRERRRPRAFRPLADKVLQAITDRAITWLYPHVPRWFGRCTALMQEMSGAINFHDALLHVAADDLGFKAIVSFDAAFDRLPGLTRVGSADAAQAWVQKRA